MLNVLQLPLNLVLLKNIEITGIHWGAYSSAYLPPSQNGDRGSLTPYLVKEPGHIPSVHGALLEYVSSLLPPSSNLHFHFSMLQSGKVAPVIYPEIYPLERLSEGLTALENRKTWGKVVVRVRDEPAPIAKL